MSNSKNIITSGKRKRAVATAVLREGKGLVRINKRLLSNITPEMTRMRIEEPLLLAGDVSKINIDVEVKGGGASSQAQAARLAIGKALVENNKKLEKIFIEYDRQLLVADVRRKESAKPNRHGQARSKVQKSYR